jgi:metallo-beta-lactamase family protein
VLLTGFQSIGTLGRFLLDGVKAVRIQGDEIKVAARIRSIDDYSGHADGAELTRWIAARRPINRGVFLVHGEEKAITGLAKRVMERIIPAAMLFEPALDDVYELSTSSPTLVEGASRRLASNRSSTWIGTTRCRGLSSISAIASRPPRTSGHAP